MLYVIHAPSYLNFADKSEGCVAGWEEWLWESFYFRWSSRLRCLRLLPPRRRPTSCAKLSERARLVTVALLCRRCQMASPDPVRAAQRSLHHQLLRSGVLITDSSRAGMPLRDCRFAPARAREQAS